MAVTRGTNSYSGATNVADLLERVLDKGVVIAGDIKISLLDIELLTIQLRLVVCSIDKAKEMGMDWWANNPVFSPAAKAPAALPAGAEETVRQLQARVSELEAMVVREGGSGAGAGAEPRFRAVDPLA